MLTYLFLIMFFIAMAIEIKKRSPMIKYFIIFFVGVAIECLIFDKIPTSIAAVAYPAWTDALLVIWFYYILKGITKTNNEVEN